MHLLFAFLSMICGVVGFLYISKATLGIGIICGGCLLGILARLIQAEYHNKAIIEKIPSSSIFNKGFQRNTVKEKKEVAPEQIKVSVKEDHHWGENSKTHDIVKACQKCGDIYHGAGFQKCIKCNISLTHEIKICQVCYEQINLLALKCRYCGETFSKIDIEREIEKRKNISEKFNLETKGKHKQKEVKLRRKFGQCLYCGSALSLRSKLTFCNKDHEALFSNGEYLPTKKIM